MLNTINIYRFINLYILKNSEGISKIQFMIPDLDIENDFLKLFYHDIVDCDLGNDNKLNLFTLKISNNRFAYNDLINELYDCIITYSLSRHELIQLENSKGGKRFIAAKEKFRDYCSNEGELGEVLLYCFLEAHLQAPKILTKLEIKTSSNDYVKGADGVHLLKLDEQNFQLVYGESKLNSDLSKGISEAFGSITSFLEGMNNKMLFENKLVNSQLVKEAVDDSTYKFLKKIIIPDANKDEFHTDNSFGVFLGYDIKIDEDNKNLDNAAFRNYLREKIKKIVIHKLDSIKKQIDKKDLWGYNFYIYTVPFTDLKTIRKDIIKELTM